MSGMRELYPIAPSLAKVRSNIFHYQSLSNKEQGALMICNTVRYQEKFWRIVAPGVLISDSEIFCKIRVLQEAFSPDLHTFALVMKYAVYHIHIYPKTLWLTKSSGRCCFWKKSFRCSIVLHCHLFGFEMQTIKYY